MRIRLATEDDADGIANIYGPIVQSTPISFETEPPTAEDMRDRIRIALESHVWLVCEELGAVAGYAYAGRHRTRAAYDWCVETSAYIGEPFRGRGIGRGLYTSLIAVLAAQGYVNAYAGITLPNAASVALHESVGFEPFAVYSKVGFKCEAWHDVGWWLLVLRDYPSVPEPPRRLGDALDPPAFEQICRKGEHEIR